METDALTDSLRETLDVLHSVGGSGEPVTTNEVAERLDVSRRSTYERLERLVDRGRIETKKVGSKGRIWWLPTETADSALARTESPEHEDGLAEEKAFVESLLDTQRDVVCAFDADGTIFRWNDRLAEVTGYTDAEIAEMRPTDYTTEAARERVAAELDRVIEAGESTVFEAPLKTADGDAVPYEFTANPITNDEGAVVGLTGVGRDVSERKVRDRQIARDRQGLEQEIEETYSRISDAFYSLDDEFRFTHVNEHAETLLQHTEEELIGRSVWDVFPEAAETEAWDCFHDALEKQEQTSYELFFDPLEFWVQATVYPSETGLSIYFRDITDRKERELALEQYETSVEAFGDGVYALDSDERFVMVNDAFCELLEFERDELIGSSAEIVYDSEIGDKVERQVARITAGEIDTGVFKHDLRTKDGDTVPVETRFGTYQDEDGAYARTGVVRDVSDRKQRERELQRRVYQQEVVATIGQLALKETDPDTVMAEAAELVADALDNDYCKVLDLDVDREELLLRQGVGWADDIVGSATVSSVEADSQAAYTLASENPVVVEDLGTESRFSGPELLTSHDVRSGISVIIGPFDDPWGILGTHDTARKEFSEQDVNFVQSVANTLASVITRHTAERELERQRSELKSRERALRQSYEIIADPDRSFTEQIDALLSTFREMIGTDYATLSRVHDDEYVFEAVDVPSDVDIRPGDTVPLAELPNCDHVCQTEQTLVLRDVAAQQPELDDPTWGISCYLGTPVYSGDEVYGTFCFYDTTTRTEEFSDWQVTFLEILGNWVSSELQRRQRTEQLSALNELNDVARGITEAVIEQPTREEIETVVCEHLAETESYMFAWAGDVDTTTQEVSLQTEAGVEGYLDDVTITIDPSDEHSKGPTGRALRTGEIQTTQDIQTDPQFEPWRDVAEKYGYRSSAAIPIAHGDSTFGVLNVYADRPNAFEGRERVVISQLGEVVGHAIAAVERKRALMGDKIVELGFRVPNVFDSHGADVEEAGRITFGENVPITDDEYLVYGEATDGAAEILQDGVEAIPHWTDLTVREDGTGFELRMSEPATLSALYSLGGSVEEAVIEDGEYRLTLHLSPSTDVRQVIDAMRTDHPTAEMVKRHQIDRSDRASDEVDSSLAESLTDRQLATLRAAYQAGFFEWPRDTTGEDVAASLDVSSPTFHQHLRKAEQKVFDSLLSST